jgi:hypothetical protein
MRKLGFLASSLALALVTAVAVTSLFSFPRDIVATKNITTFDSSTIVREKLWNESPVQLLYTFLAGGVLLNPGNPNDGGFEFGTRLRLAYGDERIGFGNTIADLRSGEAEEELESIRSYLRTSGYESLTPCPHDYDLECEVIFTWNRDRTNEVGIQIVFIRVGELEYAVVDDSLVAASG